MDILVVDDEPSIRDMLAQVLEDEGYQVTQAANGREAIQWLQGTNHPRMILLDLMMPIMNGWQFLEEQQRNPSWSSIPVVVFSAIADMQRKAIVGEVAEYLPKPINISHLLETVQRYV